MSISQLKPREKRRASSLKKTQRGAALVVALLVVAMVVMLATALSSDFLLMFRRVENQLYSEQAYAYLLGSESLARAALLMDLQKDADKRNDNLAEPWAQQQKFPTDYGWIGGRIEDAQGRFNINSVAAKATSGQGGQQPNDYSASQQFLIRLLLSLKLEQPLALDQAQALTEAVTDWIDSNDDVTGLGGAEIQYYAQADPPSRPANRVLVSPSELMLVKGMTAEIYRALAPLITVWPVSQGGGGTAKPLLNVNTAAPAVLRGLGVDKDLQPLSDSDIDVLIKFRDEHKFFTATTDIAPLFPGRAIDTTQLAVSSDYFLLNTETDFQDHRYSLHSLLHRDSSKKLVRVEERTFGEW